VTATLPPEGSRGAAHVFARASRKDDIEALGSDQSRTGLLHIADIGSRVTVLEQLLRPPRYA